MRLTPYGEVFQPGFHQALRWSFTTGGQITFRFRVPVARSGSRLRVAFLAGDGPAVITRAKVAKAGTAGALAGPAVALTFDGREDRVLAPRERAVSDPVAFPVAAFEELAVSFAADGALATSAIVAFPESWMLWGEHTTSPGRPPDAVARTQLTGLNSILVEGPPGPALVALGDSITEGYVSGMDDTRRAWPYLAGRALGLPVVNAAVSGQGLWGAIEFAEEEVLVLEGITHCLVLIGTNDLAAYDAAKMIDRLEALFVKLRPVCEVHAGTLLPKDKSDFGDLALVHERRHAVNAWLSGEADVAGVIDFASVMHAPEDVDRFHAGYTEDGIHPSIEGQRVMGAYAAQVLASLKSSGP